MKYVKPGVEIIGGPDGVEALRLIEGIARLCYKSEDKITGNSCYAMVTGLIKRKHFAMLEHVSITAKFVTDRGVTHEMVRHRLCAFAQESTRYCDYTNGKFGNEITVALPNFWKTDSIKDQALQKLDKEAHELSEYYYKKMIECGATPQEARRVLPNALKTEIVVTANIREWRHIFDLRAIGTTGAPHPDMVGLMQPCLDIFKFNYPVLFDDIIY